jgi:hypothetical protein
MDMNNSKQSTPDLTQTISKEEILDILTIVKDSLEKAWSVSCGGRKKKLKKLETLEELKTKLESCPDDVNLSMVLENAIAPSSCVPPLFGRNTNKLMEKQLNTTLQFLDEHMNKHDNESDHAKISNSFAEDGEELEVTTALSHNSSLASTTITHTSYDADSEREINETLSDGLSEGSNDVVITTCNVQGDLGPLGVSITTWSRRKLHGDSMRSRSTIFDSVAEAEKTSDLDDEGKSDEGDDGRLEEVSVSVGNIVVHTSRTRSVRFSGVKPSTEDNINRAIQLLQNAKLKKQQMTEMS